MASSRVYYDSRNRKGEGLLSIIIRHKSGMFTVPLNIHLKADQWDKQKQEVNRKHPQNRLYNNHIRSILAKNRSYISGPDRGRTTRWINHPTIKTHRPR